jgi:hypothetical protein
MAVILDPKWPPKYKNPPIWAKFGFQVDYNVANWYPLFGSHVMILQIISYLFILIIIILLLSFFCQKCVRHISRRLLNGNQWNLTGMLSTISICADYFRNFQNGRRCHGNHKKHNFFLKCSELDETFQNFCLTCVHIILRLRNFRMAAIATKNVNNLMCSELDET